MHDEIITRASLFGSFALDGSVLIPELDVLSIRQIRKLNVLPVLHRCHFLVASLVLPDVVAPKGYCCQDSDLRAEG